MQNAMMNKCEAYSEAKQISSYYPHNKQLRGHNHELLTNYINIGERHITETLGFNYYYYYWKRKHVDK